MGKYTNDSRALAKALAPEDIRPGHYLMKLHCVGECFALLRGITEQDEYRVQKLRYQFLPPEIEPLRVVSVCLPYVLVKNRDGKHALLDTRNVQFARLRKRFARRSMAGLKQDGAAKGVEPVKTAAD